MDIKVDIQGLGARIEVVEAKLQPTITCTNQYMQRIQYLQEGLDGALAKIDDLENRSRSYNFLIINLLQDSVKESEAGFIRRSPRSLA